METNKIIALFIVGLTMTCMTAEAQRTSGRDDSRGSVRTENRSTNSSNTRSSNVRTAPTNGGSSRSYSNSSSSNTRTQGSFSTRSNSNSNYNRGGNVSGQSSAVRSSNPSPSYNSHPSSNSSSTRSSSAGTTPSRMNSTSRTNTPNSSTQSSRSVSTSQRPTNAGTRTQSTNRTTTSPSQRPRTESRSTQSSTVRTGVPTQPRSEVKTGGNHINRPDRPGNTQRPTSQTRQSNIAPRPTTQRPPAPKLGATPAHRNEGSFREMSHPHPQPYRQLHRSNPLPPPRIVNGHHYYHSIPPAAHRFDHPKGRFYVNCGNFYRWHATLGYELVARPLGMFFAALPFTCVKVYVNATPYWYNDGVWFARQNKGYVIINRPLSAKTEIFIQTLPYACKKVIIEGTTYYTGENNLFLPVNGGYVLVDNAESYDVIDNDSNYDLSNFVSELPMGSKRVVVNGKLYWFGGDTWFEPVNGGYIIVDEPFR